jgi:hypothetical protein
MPHAFLDPKAADQREAMFTAIGEFIFQFSQLEFFIRMELGQALGLKEGIITIVAGPYDFLALCNVTKTILTQKDPEKSRHIEQVLNRCKRLNDERVRVAHGLWTTDEFGYRAWHVSRNTLKADRHFADPEELARLTEEARLCVVDVVGLQRDESGAERLLHAEIGDRQPMSGEAKSEG